MGNEISYKEYKEALKVVKKYHKSIESKPIIKITQDAGILNRNQVCEILGINSSTLWYWVKQGKINQYNIGDRVYYKSNQIEKILNPVT